LLGYIAYQRQPIPTRAERAERFMEQEQAWLAGFPPDAQVVLTAMMEKYRLGGLRQINDPAILRLPLFKTMGELRGVSQRFGDAAALRQTMVELQRRLYSV
jgi:type I restriction enzyme R subunit